MQNKLACDIFRLFQRRIVQSMNENVYLYVLPENCLRNLIFNKFKINFIFVLIGLKKIVN